ncbi:hypothetical protein [Candidatus Aquiluna sp. UB-MaderosW2red]|uniref:beta strand repeat-containing protein n=1 Tax=Candidatus Aquiluna sp. UB-MaderosW2red TaxID=1855377 RepID=UPI000875EDBE|nr:hypothetical protein [Candidatus Aquiluna sp. UB-MaderosW2red]SCX05866.1 hypothetical protein SAMN05216534_0457 [Candidatus Aquiluna sp. UB-MaderosW2red]
MKNNLTRKSLAIVSAASLLTFGFAGLPAQAVGISDGNVSLSPTTGAEYNMIAGGKLKLSANMSTGVLGSGKYLKFLVADALGKTDVAYVGSSRYSIASTAAANASNVVTITAAGHLFKVGDEVQVILDAADAGIDTARVTIASVPTVNTFTYAEPTASGDVPTGGAGDVFLLTSTPASGSYILDTKIATNNADKTIVLASTDEDVTQTVTVTAWVDTNDNGKIDSTEYQSPERTVSFLASSAITPTLAWNPVSVGDSTVSAEVTFSPVLNGSQLTGADNRGSAAAAVQVNMERPGSVEVEPSATVTYSNTTKKFTATSINMNSAAWDIADAVAQIAAATNFVSITSNVVTLTTTVTHALRVGDVVAVTGSTANTRVNNATAKVLSVPSATTFTYAVTTANEATDAVVRIADAAVTMSVTAVNTKILRDFAVTGAYQGQVLLFKHNAAATDALTSIGAKVSSTVGASSASADVTAPTFTGVASATINGAGTAVKTGTNAANYRLSVFNEDGDAVGAGVSVRVTTTVTSAGTVTLNGTTVTTGSSQVLSTDALGQVALAVTNSSAAANEAIVFDATVQNVTATRLTSTWTSAVYSIYDVADTNSPNSVRNRAVVTGASHTMNLRVLDQWGTAADGAIYRLAVSATQGGASVTNNVAIVAGAASVTTPDAGLTGDTVILVSFQKKSTAGVWSALDDGTVNDWAGVGSGDLDGITLKYSTQTDVFTFNADAATLPSGTVADLTAAVTTKALVAADTRFGEVAGTYTAATKAVLGGKIASTTTGAAKLGATITVASPGVLFKSGNVWAIDSITLLTNDGTFSVEAYSRISGEKTVTFTSGALTGTVKATWTGISGDATLVVTTPANVMPASTFQVKAKLSDELGNPVDTAAGRIKVTYTGAGIVFGTLPTETDANGELQFSVLLGANDTGTISVTVSYDQNADKDFVDAKDLNTTSTTTIGAAVADTKVNVGTFSGKLVVYALNAAGSEVSYKIAGKWVTQVVTSDLLQRYDRVVGATGKTIKVDIYVDGVLKLAKSVVTK